MERLGLVRRAMARTWVLAIALSGLAEATEPDYAADGFYLGAGAAFAWDDFDRGSRFEPDPDMAFGFDAWGGYRFLSFLAAELQLEYVNGFDSKREFSPLVDFMNPPPPPGSVKTERKAVTFIGNLKAYLPFGRFQPFILAGVGLGYMESDVFVSGLFSVNIRSHDSETALAARFGGGIDVYLTGALAFQLASSYVLQTGDLDGFDYVSLIAGLQYRF